MNTVNSQITDAITQANMKTLAEAPAMAAGTLYQTLAQAIGIAFENAVSAQQQITQIAEAATNQGVELIYRVDSTASPLASAPDASGAAAPSGLPSGDALSQKLTGAAQAVRATASALNAQVTEAVTFSNAAVLDNADAFAHSLRTSSAAAAGALSALNQVTLDVQIGVIKNAARAACVIAMLRAPDKSADYARVLASIEQMK